jgi:DNA-binding response OmpR family regulator
MKIMIVDDDLVTRTVLETTLKSEGHEVVAMPDGRQAWEYFNREPLRVIISDWLMPDMDGLELCRRVRARAHTPYTYFILLTAINPSRENFLKAMEEGVDDFLQKPLSKETIWARLHVAQRILDYATEIRQLQEMLPICMYCKKIREDEGYWKQIEQYISERTGSGFSHGICPDCYKTYVEPQLQALAKLTDPQPGD